MSAADTHAALERMAAIAARLGEAFGLEVETAETHARRMEVFHLFDRCFFSVRVAIALQLRLRQEARVRPMAEREHDRAEVVERGAADRDDSVERPERYEERDRDRETERATLPILLRTLEGVADAADALPGPAPAELPTLRELLAEMKSAPAAAAPKRPARPALRSRLTGATATLVLERPSQRAALPRRRATGPP